MKWLESYLSNRKQYVSINGSESSTTNIDYGVPQGSILGPLLFLVYVNDIPNLADFAKFILYADDANIILTANTIDVINEQLEKLIFNLKRWVNCNGLALNLKKTKYMIFSRARNIELPQPLVISEIPIERVYEAKFLGVIVDDSLNWSRHVKTVQSKMARYVGILYKVKKYLPLQARLQIYHSLVQSHVNYCSLVWGFSSKSNIDSLFIKQKKGLRGVIPGFINYKYKDGKTPGHTKQFFSEYKILTIHSIIALNTLIFMQKTINYPSLLPKSILNTIGQGSPVPGSTHHSCEQWLKDYDNIHYRKSIFFKGPLLFSDPHEKISLPLASYISIKLYKKNLRQTLINIQSSGEQCDWLNNNFLLYNIDGLRKSQTTYRTKVDYTGQN